MEQTSSPSQTLEKKTLSEQIYECLKNEIMTQQIHFGEKLVNRELQKRFGVSSTPVRDAINRLYTDGLITEITNGGARVIPFELEEALRINEIVAVLCSSVVKMVARRGNLPALCNILEEIIPKQEKAADRDEYIALDKSFHRAFFDLCGNGRFSGIYDQYTALREMLVRLTYGSKPRQETAIAQHKKILAACKTGEITRIEALVEEHFLMAEEWFRTGIKI